MALARRGILRRAPARALEQEVAEAQRLHRPAAPAIAVLRAEQQCGDARDQRRGERRARLDFESSAAAGDPHVLAWGEQPPRTIEAAVVAELRRLPGAV